MPRRFRRFFSSNFQFLKCELFYARYHFVLFEIGPLVYISNTSTPILYGIISWGNECADPQFPGVYARVSVYRDWINSNGFLN